MLFLAFTLSPDSVGLAINSLCFLHRLPETRACQISRVKNRCPLVYDIFTLRQACKPALESLGIETCSRKFRVGGNIMAKNQPSGSARNRRGWCHSLKSVRCCSLFGNKPRACVVP